MQGTKRLVPSLVQCAKLCEYNRFPLQRLDHRDWLAPNEVLKIFKTVEDSNQIINALHKLSTRKDYKPNEVLFSLIIDKLVHAQKFEDIHILLERIKHEKCRISDIFFYKLIKIYANIAKDPERAVRTLYSMPDFHCWPTIKTFNLVLDMLVRARKFKMIHEVYLSASKLGVSVDTCCFNILIRGLCNRRRFDAALSLLHEMPKQGCKPNATTYSTLMHFLCKYHRVEEAFQLFNKMEGDDIHPDAISFNILICGFCKRGKLDEGMELIKTMKLKGCFPNAATYQALLSGLLRYGNLVDAKHFMDQMFAEHVAPSRSSFKLLINGFCDGKQLTNAESVLRQMIGHGFVPRKGTWKKFTDAMFLKTPELELEFYICI